MKRLPILAAVSALVAAWAPGSVSGQSGYGQSVYGQLNQPSAVAPPGSPSPWVTEAPAYGGIQQSPTGSLTWGAPEPSAYGYATPNYGGAPAYTPAPPQPAYEEPAFNPYSAGQAAPAPLLPGGVDWGNATTERVTARAGGGTVLGDDIGFEGSHAWFQGFFPLLQSPGQSTTFIDTRAIKFFEDSEAYGLNVAAGYRRFAPGMNRVNGGYASYDYRNTGRFDFNQVSFGLESLGRLWDARVNGYIVAGNDRFLLSTSDAFEGPNLVRTLNYFDAFSGFDGEIGRNLTPASPDLDLRVFVGGYRFTSSGPDNATGVRVRGEARFWDQVDVGVAFQHDSFFDTTFNVSVAFLLGGNGRSTTETETNQAHRLDDPLRKNMHIVLGDVTERQLHLDPDDGEAVVFLHGDSNADAGGDGTFEAPLQTLAAIEAAAAADNPDVVLLHGDSVFTDQGIAISNAGQQLLGEASNNVIESQFGAVTLPTANGGATPIIDVAGAPAAVTLAADNTEVANLVLRNADVGILASPSTGLLIRSNTIEDVTQFGVSGGSLIDARIESNTILRAGTGGIALTGTTAGPETSITSNVIRDTGGVGIDLTVFAQGVVDSNSISNNDGSGLRLGSFTGGTLSNNASSGNLGNGFEITTQVGGILNSNSATANRGTGFLIGTATDGTVGGPADMLGNTALGNDGNGFEIGTIVGAVSVERNLARLNGQTGFLFGTLSAGTISTNQSDDNGSDGFGFTTITGGVISDNDANDNAGFGYRVLAMPGGSAPNNTGTGNAGGDTLDMP